VWIIGSFQSAKSASKVAMSSFSSDKSGVKRMPVLLQLAICLLAYANAEEICEAGDVSGICASNERESANAKLKDIEVSVPVG
jgi:hypothetical protein